MSYTILSAAYADERHTAAIVETVESGSVAICRQDRPELWDQMVRNHAVAAFVPPPAPVAQVRRPTVDGAPASIPPPAPVDDAALAIAQQQLALQRGEIDALKETMAAMMKAISDADAERRSGAA